MTQFFLGGGEGGGGLEAKPGLSPIPSVAAHRNNEKSASELPLEQPMPMMTWTGLAATWKSYAFPKPVFPLHLLFFNSTLQTAKYNASYLY